MPELFIYSLDSIKHLEPRERQLYTDVQMEAAAEGIFNALDKDLKEKYTPKQIYNMIKSSDKNKDGVITCDEAGGDIDNIFGLKTCENNDVLDRVQTSVNKMLELADIKSIEKGLTVNKALWFVAKGIILKHTNNEDFKKMFSNEAVAKYYSKEMGINKEINKRLVELFKARNITEDDIRSMCFSEKVLNEILNFYRED